MTQDVITYCADTDAFVAELLEKFPTWVDTSDEENPKFLVDKSNMKIRNGNETLALARLKPENIEAINSLDTLTILGSYKEIFADPEKTAIYDRVYDQTPVEFDDGEGGISVYTPSRKFVVLA